MNVDRIRVGDRLELAVSGRIDGNAAAVLETAVNNAVTETNDLLFDFSHVNYISSAGLRVLLKAQKAMTAKHGVMAIENATRKIMEIFQVAGFTNLMQVSLAPRQVSTDNCTLIGRGVTGECYRVDDETLLKLYYEHVPADMARKEKSYAAAAFVAGVPTAISYDVVACGRRKGILYEMLNARTLSQIIIDNPDQLEKHTRTYVDICKQIHAAPGNAAVFPRTKEACIKAIETVDFLDDTQRAAVLAKAAEIPDVDGCVHGDLHTSNILVQDDSPRLIDIGDFSIGYHMFDIAQIYNIYYSSLITGISEKALGMSPELAFKIWTLFEEYYFDAVTEEQRNKVREEASFYGSLRMFMFYEAFGKDRNLKKWILERFIPTL